MGFAFYTYSTSAWGDLLTKHGSTSISYDAIGNPLNWRGYINLTWDKRSLTSLDFNYGSGVTFDMSFEYNSDGIRTQKTVIDPLTSDNYTVKYVLDGSKILRETRINNTTGAVVYTMDFMYDDSGVAGFIYNGTSYYYIKNLQGDVLYICNASGNIVVAYTYDAWGNILSTTGSMVGTIGKYNPFRYRGYYYDSEIALYYLNSRYYDPQVGRFINADGYVSTGRGILGNNMFAYCNNNPIKYIDKNGDKVVENNEPLKEEFDVFLGIITVQLSWEYTGVPELEATLSDIVLKFDGGEVSMEFPDETTLNFEFNASGIKPTSVTSQVVEIDNCNIESVLDETGIGYVSTFSYSDFELSLQVTYRPSIKFDFDFWSGGGTGASAVICLGAAGMYFAIHMLQSPKAALCRVAI